MYGKLTCLQSAGQRVLFQAIRIPFPGTLNLHLRSLVEVPRYVIPIAKVVIDGSNKRDAAAPSIFGKIPRYIPDLRLAIPSNSAGRAIGARPIRGRLCNHDSGLGTRPSRFD